MDALSPADFRHRRFSDPAKFAPVVFVCCTILILYSVFMLSHCLPMLQVGAPLGEYDGGTRRRAAAQAVFFHVVTAMVIVCYVLSIVVHPGAVPDTPEWELYPENASVRKEFVSWSQQETKKSGDRRQCKWCNKYKPDRCHHCRVCRMCILKMDHHCPWIYNCVGFRNYKYFFLLLLYCTIDLHFIIWSMGFSVFRVVMDPDAHFLHMCSILFGESLAVFLGGLVTAFFGFHTWLTISAMTTIEFCEKKIPKKGQSKGERSGPRSMYHFGALANVRAAFGGTLWAALLPLPPSPESDGLSFTGNDTRLTSDLVARDARRLQTHRVAQRAQVGHSTFAGAPEPLWSHPNENPTISILD